jgi:hypothetical protein
MGMRKVISLQRRQMMEESIEMGRNREKNVGT